MNDPRTSPDPALIKMHEPAQVTGAVVDLTRHIDGPRDRQLLFGDAVSILNRTEYHCLIRAQKDGYCGWVKDADLGPPSTPTHRVTAPATHAYAAADIKSQYRIMLSFGSSVTAFGETATFIESAVGFIPRQHVHPVDTIATDPAAVAALFLGTPYLWGGNSYLGIDCSGLVQAACLACAIACPGDSDQQSKEVGTPLTDGSDLRRNDLIFWKGHLAIVADASTIIHANAGYMSVVYEPLDAALTRIETQGDGLPTGFRRLL
jgi:cell wall-associated NlpC family hydrolase